MGLSTCGVARTLGIGGRRGWLGRIDCRTEPECYVCQVEDVYDIVCVQVNAESALGRAVGSGTPRVCGSARPGCEADCHQRQVYDVHLSIMVYVNGPSQAATTQPR